MEFKYLNIMKTNKFNIPVYIDKYFNLINCIGYFNFGLIIYKSRYIANDNRCGIQLKIYEKYNGNK